MQEFHNSVEYDNLLYHHKGSIEDKDFSVYNNAKSLFDMIRNHKICLSHAEENQSYLESNLTDIKIGDTKSSGQKR